MAKYKKRPVIIDAIVFNGSNCNEIFDFINKPVDENIIVLNISNDGIAEGLLIPTLEGSMRAQPGDFIIKGVKGEFYPCKPDIFNETYDLVTWQKGRDGF